MESWRHAGSFRQRARNAERTTKQLHAISQHKVAVRTHEAIREFEESLRIAQEAAADVDDLPMDAEAGASHAHRWRRPAPTFQQPRDNGSDSERSVVHRVTRTLSDGALTGATTLHPGHPGSLEEKEALHAQRPPSPVHFYDYGGITLRPRSRLSQRRNKSGGPSRPKYRQGICGFYFPGPDCRQGPYGFSLLDPIHMPPRNWEEGRVPPERWDWDPSAWRPFTAEGHDRPRSSVTFLAQPELAKKPDVRPNRAIQTMSRAVGDTLCKRREEYFLEQVRHEQGVFEARWRDPMLDRVALTPQEDDSLEQRRTSMLVTARGTSQSVEDIATRIILGLEAALRENRGKLPHLFRAVNQGVIGVLEPSEFLEGLCRLKILERGELREDDIVEVMIAVDADFDGRINFSFLDRAIANAKQMRKQHSQGLETRLDETRPQTVPTYGKAAPVPIVKVDRIPKSLCNFEMSFDKFRKQQRELLLVHNETPTALH